MATDEIELKALMLASLGGDEASHRMLLARLSGRLRAYYKGKLAGIGRVAAEAEDLVQEAVVGDPPQPTYLRSRRASDAMGTRNRSPTNWSIFCVEPVRRAPTCRSRRPMRSWRMTITTPPRAATISGG